MFLKLLEIRIINTALLILSYFLYFISFKINLFFIFSISPDFNLI